MLCNTELCVQCGACQQECPFELLVEDKQGYPKLRLAAKKACLACGHCVAVCPVQALSLPELPVGPALSPQMCTPLLKELRLSPEQVEQFMTSRRSIRNFKSKTVPDDELSHLLQVAAYAPSAHNKQPVHWIVTRTPEATNRLAGLVVEFMEASRVFPGLVRHWKNGEDKVLRGAPHVAVATAPVTGLNPAEDSAVAIAHLELAVHAHGLGACWAGFLMEAARDYPPLAQAIGLPEGHQVYGALALGYPRFRYNRIPIRRPAKISWL